MEPKTRRPRAARSRGLGRVSLGLGAVVGGCGCDDDSDEELRSRSGVVGPKQSTIFRYAGVPGRTTSRARRSASMRGRE